MSIYNHYYSRGYVIDKSSDGKHRPPENLFQGSGYSTVGCSSGLRNSIIDTLESSSFMDFSASGDSLRSLYLYPRFSETKGQRYAILGQAMTHPEGNFADSRASYFAHNCIIGLADFCSLIASRSPELILQHRFKDIYVDSKSSFSANELSLRNCIDSPVEMNQFTANSIQSSANIVPARVSADFIRELIYAISKSGSHCLIPIEDETSMDEKAKAILWTLYKWLPQKILQNLGFITCLNSSKAHKTCNIIFCTPDECRNIQAHGLGEIKPSAFTVIDFQSSSSKNDNRSGYNSDDNEYIEWLVKCISGNYNGFDEELLRKLDEQEQKIDQRTVPFGLISKIYKLILCQVNNRNNPNEMTARSLGIASFALLNVTAASVPASVDNLLPVITEQLDNVVLGGQVDKLIIDIDSKYPNLINKLENHLTPEVTEAINDIRFFNSSLTILKSKCTGNISTKTAARIAEGARVRYRANDFDPSECALGYEIGLFALSHSNWDEEIQLTCRDLFRQTFDACDSRSIKVFTNVNNLESMLNALAAISLANGKATANDCEKIFLCVSDANKAQQYNTARKIIQNTRSVILNDRSRPLLNSLATYFAKLCIANNYETQILVALCKFLTPKDKCVDVWQHIVKLSSQIFTSCVASGADTFKTLRGTVAIAGLAPSKISFIEEIAPSLTLAVVSKAPNENAKAKGLKDNKALLSDIYDAILSGCSENTLSTSAKSVKDIILQRTVTQINGFTLNQAVSDRYRNTLSRERATSLDKLCKNIAPVKKAVEYNAFWNQLGIPPYPEYTRTGGIDGVIENLYLAFSGDEDRKEQISARIKDFENSCDLETIGVFSNNRSVKSTELFRIIAQKGSDSELFQSFKDMLQRMYDKKIDAFSNGSLSTTERWIKYISLLANSIIYNFGTIINTGNINNAVRLSAGFSDDGAVSITEICKKLGEANTRIKEILGTSSQIYNNLLESTSSARRALDKDIENEIVAVKPYADIAGLYSSGLIDEADRLFPNALNAMLDSIEFGKRRVRSEQNMLSAKLHQGRKQPYCQNDSINERLQSYLKKYPKSKVARWAFTAAAAAAIVILGVYGIVFYNKPIDILQYELITDSEAISYFVNDNELTSTPKVYKLAFNSVKGKKKIKRYYKEFKQRHQKKPENNAPVTYDSDQSIFDFIVPEDESLFGYSHDNAIISLAIVRNLSDDLGSENKDHSDPPIYALFNDTTTVKLDDNGHIALSDEILDKYNITSAVDVYISQTNWEPTVKIGEKDYPSLCEAIEDIRLYGLELISDSDLINYDAISSETTDLLNSNKKFIPIDILKDQVLDSTIVINGNIGVYLRPYPITSDAVVISRKEGFGDELIHIGKDAGCALEKVLLDGGAEYTSDFLDDINPSDTSISNETIVPIDVFPSDNAIFKRDAEVIDGKIVIKNVTESSVYLRSVIIQYSGAILPSEGLAGCDEYDVDVKENGIIKISPKAVEDQSDGHIEVSANKEYEINIPWRISEDEENNTGKITVQAVFDPFVVSSSDIYNTKDDPNSTIVIHRKYSICSSDALCSLIPCVDGKEVLFTESFDPEKTQYELQIPYDTERISFITETASQSATTNVELQGNSVLLPGGNLEYIIYVYSPEKEDPAYYSVIIQRCKQGQNPPDANTPTEGVFINMPDGKMDNIGSTSAMPLIVNNGELIIGSDSVLYQNCVVGKDAVGGLLNSGNTIISGKIEDNWALGTDPSNCIAGGVYNLGTLNLIGECSISNNIAYYKDNNGVDGTGGIKNSKTGSIMLCNNATVNSNLGSTVGGITHSGKGGLAIIGNVVIKDNRGYTVGGVLCKDGKRIQLADAPIIIQNKSFVGNSDIRTDKNLDIIGDISFAVIGIDSDFSNPRIADFDSDLQPSDYIGSFFSDITLESPKIVQEDNALIFSDEMAKNYCITIESSEHGKLSFTGSRLLGDFQTWSVKIEPDEGYKVGAITDELGNPIVLENTNELPISCPEKDKEYMVSFVPKEMYDLELNQDEGCLVTLYTQDGLSYSETTQDIIMDNSDVTLSIDVFEGYELNEIRINGEIVDFKTENQGTTQLKRIIEDIRGDLSITIICVKVNNDTPSSDLN